MYVKERFALNGYAQDFLRSLVPPFGYNGFGELVFYRTYSRMKRDGGQEDWADCVIRVVEGTLSIRKDWYVKNRIQWSEDFWQEYASKFTKSMFLMQWLPPGRGLWAMGSDFVYERGSMALNNCGYCEYGDDFGSDLSWMMDALMCVPGDTWTLTMKGPMRVDELVGKACNLIVNGEAHATTGFFYTGEKEVFEVETSEGHKLRATADHKVLAQYDDQSWWQRVDYLRLGDKLHLHDHRDLSYQCFEACGTWQEGYLLGWLFSDGIVSQSDAKLYFYPDDYCMLDAVCSSLHKPDVRFHERDAGHTECFTVHSKELNRLCAEYGIDSDKKVNALLEQCSDDFARGFISAFFDTDGSVAIDDAAALLSQSNLPRLEAVQRILLRLGINSTVRLDRPAGFITICGRRVNQAAKYVLRVEKENIDRFLEMGLFQNPVKAQALSEKAQGRNRVIHEKFLATVKSIRSLGIQKVYDVTVPGVHAFDANGFVVHNCGVGVGFKPLRNDSLELHVPHGTKDFVIPDSREGWCEASQAIVDSYLKPSRARVRPIYDLVRPEGLPIKGFGGISSGPGPLIHFHEQLVSFLERYRERKEYDSVRLKADCGNTCGQAVVAGNIRRSAEIMIGSIHDEVYLNLKDYRRYPERAEWGWTSNNSVELIEDSDFEMLGEIAKRVLRNGEPGYINRQNMVYARIGKKMKGLRKDPATGLNPCGESCLEDRELCCQVETYPTVCRDTPEWLQSCEYATLYASTVSLLPTHQPTTNRVIARNRRITVGLVDYTGWKHEHGVNKITKWLREGYDLVRSTNKWSNEEAGVPLSIRVTTIKPGGTSPKLPGRTSGGQHPNFHHMIRRIRIAKNSLIHPMLAEAGIPYEEDVRDKYTDVFEYPILQGPAKPADQVTIWEQAMNVILLQREWSDNAVSCTLNFRPMWPLIQHIECDFEEHLAQYVGTVTACNLLWSCEVEYVVPERYRIVCSRDQEGDLVCVDVHEYDPKHEEGDIEAVLSAIAPLTKSVALLPHSVKGAYAQMPEEGITPAEYERRLAAIRPIDWSQFSGSDGVDERYCTADACTRP